MRIEVAAAVIVVGMSITGIQAEGASERYALKQRCGEQVTTVMWAEQGEWPRAVNANASGPSTWSVCTQFPCLFDNGTK